MYHYLIVICLFVKIQWRLKMIKEKQPGINFENIILKDLSFTRKPEMLNKLELSIELDNNISFSEKKDKLTYELICSINDANDSFKINCTMVGIFSIISEEKNMDLTQFANNNAPALIFPYIREIIATTTLKAGIQSVLMPPLNIYALINKKNK